jgi:hypothetical protein
MPTVVVEPPTSNPSSPSTSWGPSALRDVPFNDLEQVGLTAYQSETTGG